MWKPFLSIWTSVGQAMINGAKAAFESG